MAPIGRTLGISRAWAYRESVGRPARYARADDRVVSAQIRSVIRVRASYGVSKILDRIPIPVVPLHEPAPVRAHA
jgi:hypothetical protein